MLRAWLKRYLVWPRAYVVAIGLGIVLSLPSLRLGLALDDYWQRGKLLGARWPVGSTGTFNLFEFATGSPTEHDAFIRRGFTTWWVQPGLRISFFRPLSCLTHALDYALWPKTPALMHAQSILWYGALLGVAWTLYRRWLAPAAANVAILFYAIDPTHSLPVGWVANRNALIAATFGLLALSLYDRRRHLLAAIVLGVALACGESATAVLGLFGAHWVVLERRKLTSILPIGVVVVAWAMIYKLGHYGVAGSGLYSDPTSAPAAYGKSVIAHVPVLLADELNAPSPDLYPFMPVAAKVALGVVAVLFIAWAAAVAPRADRTTRFLALGAVAAVLPGAATAPSGRLLLVAGFALIGIVGQICAGAVTRAAKAFAALSWLSHGLFAVPMFVASLGGMSFVDHSLRAYGAGIPVDGSARDKRLVLVNAPDTAFMYYVIVDPLEDGKSPPETMLIASGNARNLTLTRTSATAIRVHEEGGFYRDDRELLFRDVGSPMTEGTTLDQGDTLITVRHVGADGVPDEAEIVFRRPLDEAYVFRAWRENALVPFELPAIGEHVTFPGRTPLLL